jgi:hypothetical protein
MAPSVRKADLAPRSTTAERRVGEESNPSQVATDPKNYI